MNNHKNKSGQWSIMGLFSIILAGIMLFFSQTMQSLNNATNDLTDIQYLSSSTQRCIRIALLNGSPDTQLMFLIGNQTEELLQLNSDTNLSVLDNLDYVPLADEVLDYWHSLFELVSAEEIDTELTQIVLDNHFDSMTLLSDAINSEVDSKNSQAFNLQYAAFITILAMIGLMASNFLQTTATLKQNKELAKLAAIDTATGLFNRSKCQDLFKSTTKSTDKDFPAVIVIDLNDLKKTNDKLGHRVGDELILSFASLLKEACNLHTEKPFVGRYGGDEFVIFYRNVESEADILTFLKELNFLSTDFNKQETRFAISYASGYELNNSSKAELSVRELFDLADENMYKNKQAMKREQFIQQELAMQNEQANLETTLQKNN